MALVIIDKLIFICIVKFVVLCNLSNKNNLLSYILNNKSINLTILKLGDLAPLRDFFYPRNPSADGAKTLRGKMRHYIFNITYLEYLP